MLEIDLVDESVLRIDLQFPVREFLDHFRVRGGDKSYIRVEKNEDSVPELYAFPIARGTHETVMPVLKNYFENVAFRNDEFRGSEISDLCKSEHVQGEILVNPLGQHGQAFLDYVIDSIKGYGMETTELSDYVPKYSR